MRIQIALLILAILLISCQSGVPPASPTPAPSATASATSSNLPGPQVVESTPTQETPELLAPASTATPPSPALAPGAGVSQALVSSRGQVAYIRDSVLFVEDDPGTLQFSEIAHFVRFARWSPDGSRLLFDRNEAVSQDNTRAGALIEDYQLWLADLKQVVSLGSMIPDFPAPPYLLQGWIPLHESGPAAFRPEWIDYAWKLDTTAWSSDGNKILFVNLVSPERLPVSFPGSQTVSVADLETGEFRLAAEAVLISALHPLDGQIFLLQDHCGSPCEWLTGYNLFGEKQWELPWVTTGFFALTPDRQHLVNAGRIAINEPTRPNTVDLVDTQDGSVQVIWELESEDYFPLQSELSRVLLSPDGSFASFNIARGTPSGEEYFLAVIDLPGGLNDLIPNAVSVAWSAYGELTVLQLPDPARPGEVRLANWITGQNDLQTIYGPLQAALIEGIWSPDGNHLAFCSFDPHNQSIEINAWARETGELIKVKSAPSPAGRLCNLVWLPDSSAFYFNLSYPNGTLTSLDLWRFQTSTHQAEPVARSAVLP